MDYTSAKGGKATSIQAVRNSFEIVDILIELGGRGDLATIASESSLSKSSVHKHLRTLVEGGFVRRNDGRYQLGLHFLEIGSQARELFPQTSLIKRKVQKLANLTGEIGFFFVEDDGRAVILFREMGAEAAPTRSRVGMPLYMHQIAAGKAMLAEYPPDLVQSIVNRHGLPEATDNTITDYEELLASFEQIHERGYATCVGEATDGLQSFGVAVKRPNGEVFGGFGVGGPRHRMPDPSDANEIPKKLQSIANEVELSITYS